MHRGVMADTRDSPEPAWGTARRHAMQQRLLQDLERRGLQHAIVGGALDERVAAVTAALGASGLRVP